MAASTDIKFIVCAFGQLRQSNVGCFAHTLQLAVLTAVDLCDVSTTLAWFQSLVA